MTRATSLRIALAAAFLAGFATLLSPSGGSLASSESPAAEVPAEPAPAMTGTQYGDIDGNGTITSVDALAALSHVVGKSLPAGWSVDPHADANCDATVTTLDALIILSHVVGRDVSQFCVATSIVASVEVTPDSATLFLSDTLTVSAVARDGNGVSLSDPGFAWSSSDTGKVLVESSGKLQARGEGEAWIRAEIGGVRDSLHVSVGVTPSASAFLRITLPGGISAQGLQATLSRSETPVASLDAVPVELNPNTIQLGGIQTAEGNTVLLVQALYPGPGDTLDVSVHSTAQALVLQHPLVAAALFFAPGTDAQIASAVAALPETQSLAAHLEQQLPATPELLSSMDQSTIDAINAAALAYLATITDLPTKTGPQGVSELRPDATQSGITLTTSRQDSADVPKLRVELTNDRRRYLQVFVQDSTGAFHGSPKTFLVAPASNLIAFDPLSESTSETLIPLEPVSAAPGSQVSISIYGPGAVGIGSFGRWDRLFLPAGATAMSQIFIPVLGAALDAPAACVASMGNTMFSAVTTDAAIQAEVQTHLQNQAWTKALITVVVGGMTRIADANTLASMLLDCGISAAGATEMAAKLGAYAVPVLGQLGLVAKAAVAGSTIVPTIFDVGRSAPVDTWTLDNRITVELTASTDRLNSTLRTTCVFDTVTALGSAPCARTEWDFGDGSQAATDSDSIRHTFAASGEYLVTVTGHDGAGASATDTLTVAVAEPAAGRLAFFGCPTNSAETGCKDGGDVLQLYVVDVETDSVRQLTSFSSRAEFTYPILGCEFLGFPNSKDRVLVSPDGNWLVYPACGGPTRDDDDFAVIHALFVPPGSIRRLRHVRPNWPWDGGTNVVLPLNFGPDGQLTGWEYRNSSTNPETNGSWFKTWGILGGEETWFENLHSRHESSAGVCVEAGGHLVQADGTLLGALSSSSTGAHVGINICNRSTGTVFQEIDVWSASSFPRMYPWPEGGWVYDQTLLDEDGGLVAFLPGEYWPATGTFVTGGGGAGITVRNRAGLILNHVAQDYWIQGQALFIPSQPLPGGG